MSELRKQLVRELSKIPSVVEKKWPERDDGFTTLHINGREFAHILCDNKIDIRLTKSIVSEHSLLHPTDSISAMATKCSDSVNGG
jgi:hypothetical protein